ncbi:helix-turn-helix transcriptional regulator [Flavobacterium sp.]|uniref:helix-turn-helix transcriptional regulator n=1 Tax=Flavobacterium sp. TaxID=239 RepID=UPI0025B806F4|nr:helix-turn-helix transcriptional regulator [Flavobacterium sp.]
MVNIDDFVKRLEIILDYYALNASSFADKIGVQRSSMSHLLSGRNKPSLDFVLKILEVFPDIDLYWILNGKGSFPKTEDATDLKKNESLSEFAKPLTPISSEENFVSENEKSKNTSSTEIKTQSLSPAENEIEKIVVFYKNGTFKTYVP